MLALLQPPWTRARHARPRRAPEPRSRSAEAAHRSRRIRSRAAAERSHGVQRWHSEAPGEAAPARTRVRGGRPTCLPPQAPWQQGIHTLNGRSPWMHHRDAAAPRVAPASPCLVSPCRQPRRRRSASCPRPGEVSLLARVVGASSWPGARSLLLDATTRRECCSLCSLVRAAKQERLRQAKAEADREIAAYRAEREGAYQKKVAEVRDAHKMRAWPHATRQRAASFAMRAGAFIALLRGARRAAGPRWRGARLCVLWW